MADSFTWADIARVMSPARRASPGCSTQGRHAGRRRRRPPRRWSTPPPRSPSTGTPRRRCRATTRGTAAALTSAVVHTVYAGRVTVRDGALAARFGLGRRLHHGRGHRAQVHRRAREHEAVAILATVGQRHLEPDRAAGGRGSPGGRWSSRPSTTWRSSTRSPAAPPSAVPLITRRRLPHGGDRGRPLRLEPQRHRRAADRPGAQPDRHGPVDRADRDAHRPGASR